jgi:hypothetical protein
MTGTTHFKQLGRPVSVIIGAAGAAALLSSSGSGAAYTAEVHQLQSGGWTRFYAEDFTRAAGELCPFALTSKVLLDREYVRTTSEFPNGDPRREEYVGPLVVRVTNVDTGRSVQRDLSARGVVTYDRDGSYSFALQGPAAVGFYPGDSLTPGYYVLRARHTVRFELNGTRHLIADHGRKENLCATLS